MIHDLKKITNEAKDFYKKFVGEIMLGQGRNDTFDAYRHAYASGVFAMEYGDVSSNILGQAYEIKGQFLNDIYYADEKLGFDILAAKSQSPQKYAKEKNMDLWNNRVGREISENCSTREELAKEIAEALKSGKLITDLSDTRKYELSYEESIDKTFEYADKACTAQKILNPLKFQNEGSIEQDILDIISHSQKILSLTDMLMGEKLNNEEDNG